MSHRTFIDAHGQTWEAWEVYPEVVERRLNEERRRVPRPGPDRRQHVDIRFRMSPELRDGWLAFQSGTERRRLAPIPADWQRLPDEALVALARAARPQPLTDTQPSGRAPREPVPEHRADRSAT